MGHHSHPVDPDAVPRAESAESAESSWYLGHGWRWAWSKPWAMLRLAHRIHQETQQRSGGTEGPSGHPHWIYFVDAEAFPHPDPHRSVEAVLEWGAATIARAGHGIDVDEFVWYAPAGTSSLRPVEGGVNETVKLWGEGVVQSNNDQALFNANSANTHDFLRRWIGHDDCEGGWTKKSA